jgi:hypothetical protein
MLSDAGNPHARNLLELVAYLQKADGAKRKVSVGDGIAA